MLSYQKGNDTLGELHSKMEVQSNVPQTRRYLQISDGSILDNFCPRMKPTDVQRRKASEPLTETQKQLVLGTLLGDGCMSMGAISPRYRCSQGAKQTEYVLHKARILEEYINTPPAIFPNGGFGEELCAFVTLSSQAFEFTRSLCYQQMGNSYVKTITQEWVDQLTWEAVAWWYQDDGSLHKGSVVISTHGFPKEQVDMLTQWFVNQGLDAITSPVNKNGKTYYTIRFRKEGGVKLLEHIRPYMSPGMAYKFHLVLKKCKVCGEVMIYDQVICGSRECKLALHREACKNYTERHKDNPEFIQMKKETQLRASATRKVRYHSDPTFREKVLQEHKEKKKRSQQKERIDPVYAAFKKEQRKKHRLAEKQKALEDPEYAARKLALQKAATQRATERKRARRAALKLSQSSTLENKMSTT